MSSKGLREIRNPPFAQNCGKHNKDVWGCGYALTCNEPCEPSEPSDCESNETIEPGDK